MIYNELDREISYYDLHAFNEYYIISPFTDFSVSLFNTTRAI